MSHNYRRQAWQACQKEIGEQIRNMRLELDLPPQIAGRTFAYRIKPAFVS